MVVVVGREDDDAVATDSVSSFMSYLAGWLAGWLHTVLALYIGYVPRGPCLGIDGD